MRCQDREEQGQVHPMQFGRVGGQHQAAGWLILEIMSNKSDRLWRDLAQDIARLIDRKAIIVAQTDISKRPGEHLRWPALQPKLAVARECFEQRLNVLRHGE